MNLDDINMLLDKAKATTGSDYKTHKATGIPAQRISNWRHGETTMPPADVALVAHVAGLDASAWALRAMVAKHEGSAKGDLLMKALGKALVATGAAIATSGVHAMEISSTIKGLLDTMYRSVKSRAALWPVALVL